MEGGKLLCPSCPAHMPRALSVDLTQLEDPLEVESEGPSPRAGEGEASGEAAAASGRGTKAKKKKVAVAAGNISYQAEEQRMLSRKGILKRISEVDPSHLSTS